MRIIAGTARSLPLKCLEGRDTRPTTDRIKETLFNIIQPDLPESRFLDLFAGSGQIGLEALSRGAQWSVFAENNKKACACIEDNIRFTRFGDRAKLLCMDAMHALRILEGKDAFDFVFLDPPYASHYEKEILACLASSSLLKEGARVIAEAAKDTDFSYVQDLGFTVTKEKIYKTNKHVFMAKEG